jgi:hypothetical protein
LGLLSFGTKLQIQNTNITKTKSNFSNPNNQIQTKKLQIQTYSKFQNQTNPHTPNSKTKQIQITKYSKTLQIQNNQIQNQKITNPITT